MLHETLWKANYSIARACLDHPFIQGLASGNLPDSAFKKYVAQDAFFLRAFFKAYAIAAAKCEDMVRAKHFHTFMAGIFEELKLHAAYAAKLDIDMDAVTPFRATSAYADFLLRTAWHGEPAEIAAAMAPCMRLYDFLGHSLVPPRPGNPYGEWIYTYASEEFHQLTAEVEALLDAVAEDTPAVRDAYEYSLRCEFEFFSVPLE